MAVDGWKETMLSDVLKTLESGTRPKGGVSENGDIPSLGGENIEMEGGMKFDSIKKVSNTFFSKMRRGILSVDDVLINKDGANTGKVGRYDQQYFPVAAINEHLFLLRPSEQLDSKFLYFTLLGNNGQRQIRDCITGSAQPGLNSKFVNKVSIDLPPLPEQKKIAAILSSADATIAKTENVIVQTERVKQGLLQQLLSRGIGHTKFKKTEIGETPEVWTTGRVDTFFVLQRGFDITAKQAKEGDIPVISSSGFAYYHSTGKLDGSGVITGRKGKLGSVFYVEGKYWPHDTTLWVKDFKGNDPRFVYWFLLSMNLGQYDAATSVPTLNRNNIHKLVVSFPPIPEQIEIAKILDSYNDGINLQQQHRAHLKVIKKGLMSDLLTGRVRVNAAKAKEKAA